MNDLGNVVHFVGSEWKLVVIKKIKNKYTNYYIDKPHEKVNDSNGISESGNRNWNFKYICKT